MVETTIIPIYLQEWRNTLFSCSFNFCSSYLSLTQLLHQKNGVLVVNVYFLEHKDVILLKLIISSPNPNSNITHIQNV